MNNKQSRRIARARASRLAFLEREQARALERIVWGLGKASDHVARYDALAREIDTLRRLES